MWGTPALPRPVVARRDPRSLAVVAAGAVAAALVGALLAARLPVGVALLVVLCYVPLVGLKLEVAIALWAPLVFLEGVPALNAASKAAGLLLAAVWLAGLLGGLREPLVLRRHRGLVWTLGALVAWLSLSVLWAQDRSRALADVWHWWAVALLFLMVASSLRTVRAAQLVIVGLVVGAVAAVLIGLAHGDLSRTAVEGAGSRLKSGAGDPNVLAAGLVGASVLAAALMVPLRSVRARWALGVAIAALCVGVVASQSRGGGLAAVATALASVVFFRGRRRQAAGVVLLATGAVIAALALFPGAWHRISSYDNGGNGRTEIWTVAWRMSEDHPLVGVGLNNFDTRARDYVRRPGALKRVRLVVDHATVVHNVYLQLLAEDGLVGLLLFLSVAGACLRAAWLAGHRFEARGDPVGEALSRAVLIAGLGLLMAGLFLSAGVDTRLWILFALGPALLGASQPALAPARTA